MTTAIFFSISVLLDTNALQNCSWSCAVEGQIKADTSCSKGNSNSILSKKKKITVRTVKYGIGSGGGGRREQQKLWLSCPVTFMQPQDPKATHCTCEIEGSFRIGPALGSLHHTSAEVPLNPNDLFFVMRITWSLHIKVDKVE